MNGVEAERANAHRVLTLAIWGYRLLGAYLVASIAAELVIALAARGAWAPVTGAVIGVGGVLLFGVTVASRRARKELGTTRPDLLKVKKVGRGSFQPASGGGGCLYLMALTLVVAVGVIMLVVAGASAATATTQVHVDSCNSPARGEQSCTAHWAANGRTITGRITWSSEPGETVTGRYDPADPTVVYSGSTPWLNGATVIAGTYLVFVLILAGLLYRKYLRDCRRPYLDQLTNWV